MFLFVLPFLIYLIGYVGYFPEYCGCGYSFEWKPIQQGQLCEFAGCEKRTDLTTSQKLVNTTLLKEVPVTTNSTNF